MRSIILVNFMNFMNSMNFRHFIILRSINSKTYNYLRVKTLLIRC